MKKNKEVEEEYDNDDEEEVEKSKVEEVNSSTIKVAKASYFGSSENDIYCRNES